jgi:hypothetical protein
VPFFKLLSAYDQTYRKFGFILRQRDCLAAVNAFPMDYGVYTISDAISEEVLYVGKSGELLNAYSADTYRGDPTSVTWRSQSLHGRIAARHSKRERREAFYKRIMMHDKIAKLSFQCWVLCRRDTKIYDRFPFEAEADLLGAYLRQYGHLPRWNRKA